MQDHRGPASGPGANGPLGPVQIPAYGHGFHAYASDGLCGIVLGQPLGIRRSGVLGFGSKANFIGAQAAALWRRMCLQDLNLKAMHRERQATAVPEPGFDMAEQLFLRAKAWGFVFYDD